MTTRAGAIGRTDLTSLWEQVLAADSEALVTQSPQWMQALTSLGSWVDDTRVVALDGARTGILPMVRRPGFSIAASPPPAWGFGGLIAEGGVTAGDVRRTLDMLAEERFLSCSIRPNPLYASQWCEGGGSEWMRTQRRAHTIDLRQGSAAAWNELDKDTRRRVRRAERLGVEIECDNTGRLIPAFLALQQRSIERWAQTQNEPVTLARWRAQRRDPATKFEAMAAHLGDAFRLWVARHNGVAVAATLVLQGTNAHATRGVMDRDLAGPLSANALLEWRAIRDAADAGCRRYHMGESGSSRSLAKYKRSFGAGVFDYAEYRHERVPLLRIDRLARSSVKRLIGFRD